MNKSVGVITIHGMGDTKGPDHGTPQNPGDPKDFYAHELVEKLRGRLDPVEWAKVELGHVYYQPFLQGNQEEYLERIRPFTQFDWLREFIVYGFGDAATLEARKTGSYSPYFKTQLNILETFRSVFRALKPGAPVIVIAQSLGGQVFSNYLWDAGNQPPGPSRGTRYGVWSDPPSFASREEEDFCRGKQILKLITTGCNIPIFVAGLPEDKIIAIAKPNGVFTWENYYDDDDVLGYPLRPLSPSYRDLVKDHRIRAGGILESRTPLSHIKYWGDSDLLDPLEGAIRGALA